MSSNISKFSIAAVGIVVAIIVAAYFLWPTMPTVGKQANDAAMALISATSREDQQSLQKIELQIQQWASEGTLPTSEQDILTSIIELAKSGQWKEASARARALKAAQAQPAS